MGYGTNYHILVYGKKLHRSPLVEHTHIFYAIQLTDDLWKIIHLISISIQQTVAYFANKMLFSSLFLYNFVFIVSVFKLYLVCVPAVRLVQLKCETTKPTLAIPIKGMSIL